MHRVDTEADGVKTIRAADGLRYPRRWIELADKVRWF